MPEPPIRSIDPSPRLSKPVWAAPWAAAAAVRTPCVRVVSGSPLKLKFTPSRTARTPPTKPAAVRARPRQRDRFSSRACKVATNSASSARVGVREKRRSIIGSNSSADMERPPVRRHGLQPRAEFIQTTFDM